MSGFVDPYKHAQELEDEVERLRAEIERLKRELEAWKAQALKCEQLARDAHPEAILGNFPWQTVQFAINGLKAARLKWTALSKTHSQARERAEAEVKRLRAEVAGEFERAERAEARLRGVRLAASAYLLRVRDLEDALAAAQPEGRKHDQGCITQTEPTYCCDCSLNSDAAAQPEGGHS